MRDNSANCPHDILVGRSHQGRPGFYARDSLDGSTISPRKLHRDDSGQFGRDPDGRTNEPMVSSEPVND